MKALNEMTMTELVALHNELADSPVKTFRNKAQAIAVIQELQAGYEPAEPQTEAEREEMVQEQETPAPASELSAMVGQVVAAAEPAAEPEGPVLVSLADICAQVQVVPRIARRRLRKALGVLEEGRWEFAPERVDEIKALITGTATPAEAE